MGSRLDGPGMGTVGGTKAEGGGHSPLRGGDPLGEGSPWPAKKPRLSGEAGILSQGEPQGVRERGAVAELGGPWSSPPPAATFSPHRGFLPEKVPTGMLA